MKQGEIWVADLEPVRGSEQGGRRPVLIISGNALNNALPIVIAVPLSSQIKRYPTAVRIQPNEVNGLTKETEALPFQVRAAAKDRLTKRLGKVTEHELRLVIQGLGIVLAH